MASAPQFTLFIEIIEIIIVEELVKLKVHF